MAVWPTDEVNRMFFYTVPLNSIATLVGLEGRALKEAILADYAAAVSR